MNYRNKAQYPVGMGDRGPIAGFHARRSHTIIDSESCGIQHTGSETVKNTVMDIIRKLNIPVYNEETGDGILRHIITRVSYSTGDIMVILVVTKENVPGVNKLIKEISEEIPAVKSIVLNINKRRDNVILGDVVKTVYGSDTLKDKLGHLSFHISPLSFYQVNLVQTVKLYQKAVEFAGLTGNETLFDLYCGIGTISLFLAEQAREVIGVKVIPEAAEYDFPIICQGSRVVNLNSDLLRGGKFPRYKSFSTLTRLNTSFYQKTPTNVRMVSIIWRCIAIHNYS